VSVFQPKQIVSKKEAHAPIAEKLAAFTEHRADLLEKLQEGYKSGPQSQPFDEGKSWRDLTRVAELYFWSEVMKPMPNAERSNRLRQLVRALRLARGLTDRAMTDGVGDALFVAFCTQKGIKPYPALPIEKDGSTVLTRCLDEIKGMATALATLETVARAAAAKDKPDKTGRSALLPRGCIQGLARVYRNSTGTKPGRGAGPFADFAYEFMIAVDQTGFEYESLIDAIQDAHRQFKPSWFDGKPPSR
jgi:hypothetical protein